MSPPMLPWFRGPRPHLGQRDSRVRDNPIPLPVPQAGPGLAYLLVIPDRIGLLDWAATLLTDMPQDDVPALYDEKDWQSWAMALYNCPTVAQTNPPDPAAYGDWRSWAVQFYGFMNGQQPPQ